MTNSKNTKRTLIASAVSVMICVAMLIGTTFAWFTDTASTAVNKIQSGNLDIALEMEKDGKWVTAEGKTLDFKKATGAEDEEILWEPGCTYELPKLRVVNKGNLALKYKISISGIKGDAKLNEVIDWTIGDVALGEEQHLVAGASNEFTISGHMQETAGNDYMNLTIENIAITVVATQDTVESDSFDNQYDKDAQYPVVVTDQSDLNNAITNAIDKKANITLSSGKTYTLDNNVANAGDKSREITFIGDGSQTVDVASNAPSAEGAKHLNYQRGSKFTFENVTVENGTDSFDGIVCDELVYKNCVIKGVTSLYGKATFINCTFENTMTNQYSIWTWGGTDVEFDGCTFNTNGKAILLYGRGVTNLVVNKCIFNDRKNGEAGKAAIEVGNDYNATYTLSVNNATVSGFANGKNTDSKLWANKNSMDAEHLTVTIDGSKVQ